jgi:hypothetical protein
LSIVEEKKRLLTEYASLINKTIAPFNATVFEILWARDRCGQDIPTHRSRLGQVMLPVVVQYTRTQFTQTEHFLAVYGQHLVAVLAVCESLHQHPWAWITQPLPFTEEDRVLGVLDELLATMQRAYKWCEHLDDAAGITVIRTCSGLEHAARGLGLLPQAEGALVEELMVPCRSAENRRMLTEFIGQVETFHSSLDRVSKSAGNVNSLLDAQTADKLSQALECFGRWGIDGRSVAEVRDLLKGSVNTAKLLRDAHSSFRAILSVIGCDSPVTLSSAAFLLETVRVVETAPFEQLHLRLPAFEQERARPMLQTARQESAALKDAELALGAEFDLTSTEVKNNPIELLECAVTLDQASLWQRLFGRDYREAVKVYRHVARSGKKAPRPDMIRALRAIVAYTDKRAQFENHAVYREIFGVHFQGVSSPLRTVPAHCLYGTGRPSEGNKGRSWPDGRTPAGP